MILCNLEAFMRFFVRIADFDQVVMDDYQNSGKAQVYSIYNSMDIICYGSSEVSSF